MLGTQAFDVNCKTKVERKMNRNTSYFHINEHTRDHMNCTRLLIDFTWFFFVPPFSSFRSFTLGYNLLCFCLFVRYLLGSAFSHFHILFYFSLGFVILIAHKYSMWAFEIEWIFIYEKIAFCTQPRFCRYNNNKWKKEEKTRIAMWEKNLLWIYHCPYN